MNKRNRDILKYILDHQGSCFKGEFTCNVCPLCVKVKYGLSCCGGAGTFQDKYNVAMKLCAEQYPDTFLEKAL